MNLCVILSLFIIYLEPIYTIEYPNKISSSTYLHINCRLPHRIINDSTKYSRVKCYSSIQCACGFIRGLRNTFTPLDVCGRCRLGAPNLAVMLVDDNTASSPESAGSVTSSFKYESTPEDSTPVESTLLSNCCC
jgi:hypothetical protein